MKVNWIELLMGLVFFAVGIPTLAVGVGIVLIPLGLYIIAHSVGVKVPK